MTDRNKRATGIVLKNLKETTTASEVCKACEKYGKM